MLKIMDVQLMKNFQSWKLEKKKMYNGIKYANDNFETYEEITINMCPPPRTIFLQKKERNRIEQINVWHPVVIFRMKVSSNNK